MSIFKCVVLCPPAGCDYLYIYSPSVSFPLSLDPVLTLQGKVCREFQVQRQFLLVYVRLIIHCRIEISLLYKLSVILISQILGHSLLDNLKARGGRSSSCWHAATSCNELAGGDRQGTKPFHFTDVFSGQSDLLLLLAGPGCTVGQEQSTSCDTSHWRWSQ